MTVSLIPAQTVLTPNSAANDLRARGIDSLGLASPSLSPMWAGSNAAAGDYNASALTLQLSSPRAAFRGIATWWTQPVGFSDTNGNALAGPALVVTLHPEAVHRLQAEIDLRTNSTVYSVPVAMLVRNAAPPATLPPPQIYLAGETLVTTVATVTFHDNRGLIVDPVAVACQFNDLIGWRPALIGTAIPGMTLGGPGGLTNMIGLAAGDLCHVVDPHGWRFNSATLPRPLRVVDGSGNAVSTVPATGLAPVAAQQTIGRSSADVAATPAGGWMSMRWGFARNGALGTANISLPAIPNGVTLARRFFRIMAVDLDFHIRGNRTGQAVADAVAGVVPADDGAIPAFLLPQVRDQVPGFAWLGNGADVMGAMGAMAQNFAVNPTDQLFAIAVSPAIDPTISVPAAPGPGAQWPNAPTPASPPADVSLTLDPRQGAAAHWRNPGDGPGAVQDVILTLKGNAFPVESHVRAYPRTFVEIGAIAEQPSFVRGDGGAAIANGVVDVKLLLVNPFALGASEPHPPNGTLIFDLVVVARTGRRRMYSAVKIPVDPAPEAMPNPPSFGGTPILAAGRPLAAVLDGLMSRSIAPTTLFGLPQPAASGGQPTSVLDLVRRLASDEQPRQGPRLPTQARFDTELVTGVMPTGQATYTWSAVVTGGRLTAESLGARPDLANAGHPAGPDVNVAGVACQGWLARDVALHALKRAQPIFIPTGGTNFRGWIASVMDNKWNDPPQPAPAGTIAAVVLETIAPLCETPELAAAPQPQPGATTQNLINLIATQLGIPPPTVTIGNEARVVPIIQREIAAARSGQRDALWSLTRAIGQARELVYIETPGFAHTADPGASVPDLVQTMINRLGGNRRLKIIICLPREGDFDRSRPAWTVTAMDRRKTALNDLIAAGGSNVVAFHPIGFPGRAPAIRTTTVIVDDVYCLTGTSHFRRRGMTFDGALDIAGFDGFITDGYSAGIASFRRRLMAAKLGVPEATTVAAATAMWVRLATPEGAFATITSLLRTGGAGRLEPVWAGAQPDNILPQAPEVVDPDGTNTGDFLQLFASLLLEGP